MISFSRIKSLERYEMRDEAKRIIRNHDIKGTESLDEIFNGVIIEKYANDFEKETAEHFYAYILDELYEL